MISQYIYIHIYIYTYIYICDISITYPSYIHHISIITSFTNFPCPSVLNISTWRFLPSASRPIAIQVTSDGVRNGHGPENRGQAEKDAWRGAGGVNDGGYFIERKEDVYSQQNFRCYFVMCMWYITCIWSNCCVYIYIYDVYVWLWKFECLWIRYLYMYGWDWVSTPAWLGGSSRTSFKNSMSFAAKKVVGWMQIW